MNKLDKCDLCGKMKDGKSYNFFYADIKKVTDFNSYVTPTERVTNFTFQYSFFEESNAFICQDCYSRELMKEILILILILAACVVCFGLGFITDFSIFYFVGLIPFGLFFKGIFNFADKDRERGNELAISNKKDSLMKTHGNKLIFYTPKQAKKSLTFK
jgi:hypothetical protein